MVIKSPRRDLCYFHSKTTVKTDIYSNKSRKQNTKEKRPTKQSKQVRKLLKGQDSAPTGKVTRTAQRDTNEPNKTKKSRYFISFFKKKEKQIQQFIPGVRYITSPPGGTCDLN